MSTVSSDDLVLLVDLIPDSLMSIKNRVLNINVLVACVNLVHPHRMHQLRLLQPQYIYIVCLELPIELPTMIKLLEDTKYS